MTTWVQKLISQFEDVNSKTRKKNQTASVMSEEKATILFFVDQYIKNLIDFDNHSARKEREKFDQFIQQLIQNKSEEETKIYFNLRQYFQSYRTEEMNYIQKTMNDFKSIIWNFANQINEEYHADRKQEDELDGYLSELKSAVESESVEDIKKKSQSFIKIYNEKTQERKERKNKTLKKNQDQLKGMQKDLLTTKKELETDHLTGAHNRRSFEGQFKKIFNIGFDSLKAPVLVLIDIDFFKKVNDSYGHDIGDLVLIECVKMLKETFAQDYEMVARLGGEEFIILNYDTTLESVVKKLIQFQNRLRKEVFIMKNFEIKFTVSAGVAQADLSESPDETLKRADLALYEAKRSGRDKYIISEIKQLKAVS